MKNIRAWVFLTFTTLALASGCDHAANNEPAPDVQDFVILNPNQNAYVDGTVEIEVAYSGASPEKMEFYINGALVGTKTSPPWRYSWNTAGYPSQSSQSIVARAYNKVNSYRSTQSVVVRIK